jgi:hypothetical protein
LRRWAGRKSPVPPHQLANNVSREYGFTMTLAEIKQAIPQLTLEEKAELARCLHEWADDEWDAQMKNDLASGKFDKLLSRIDAHIEDQKWERTLNDPSPRPKLASFAAEAVSEGHAEPLDLRRL